MKADARTERSFSWKASVVVLLNIGVLGWWLWPTDDEGGDQVINTANELMGIFEKESTTVWIAVRVENDGDFASQLAKMAFTLEKGPEWADKLIAEWPGDLSPETEEQIR